MVNSALDGIEEIINNLSPSELLRHGLIESVQRLVTRINRVAKQHFRSNRMGRHLRLDITRSCSFSEYVVS